MYNVNTLLLLLSFNFHTTLCYVYTNYPHLQLIVLRAITQQQQRLLQKAVVLVVVLLLALVLVLGWRKPGEARIFLSSIKHKTKHYNQCERQPSIMR